MPVRRGDPDSGEILLDGKPIHMDSPTAARELGIETVYQDLAVAPDLDPAANLFLGREIKRKGILGALGMLDKKEMRRRASEEFARLGVSCRAWTCPIGALSGGQRQSVAVARSVVWASKVVFMDEPTAALGVVQRERVLDVITQGPRHRRRGRADQPQHARGAVGVRPRRGDAPRPPGRPVRRPRTPPWKTWSAR